MNHAKLKGAIIARGKSISETAEAIGLSNSAFYRRLCGAVDFDRTEINRLSDFLQLSGPEILEIFFED